jgi:hypothetical protein
MAVLHERHRGSRSDVGPAKAGTGTKVGGSAVGPARISGTGGANYLSFLMRAVIIAVGCLSFVAHAATDWDDLKWQASSTSVRLEPPEYGMVKAIVFSFEDPRMASSEGGSDSASASRHGVNNVEINLRI